MKKKLAMIFAACMTLSMTMGCNVFGAETSENENNAKLEQQMPERKEPQQKGDMAKVVEVNENSIVVKLAEKPEGEEGERPLMPEDENGEMPPEKPDGKEGERPPMPEGENGEMPPEKPEGEEGERPPMPRHGGRMMKEMNFSEEEIEIALNDSIVIDLGQGAEGSIEDIAVDDVVMIAYEEDGETIKSIFIRQERPEKELTDIPENN